VETVRTALRALDRRDVELYLSAASPEIELITPAAPLEGVNVGHDGIRRFFKDMEQSAEWSSFEVREVRAAERSAGRRGGQLGEHRGLPLERLLVAVEGIAVGQLAGVEVADMRPVGVLPDQHSQRQLDADAGVGLHQGGADAHVAEDQQDVGFQLDIGLASAGRMVDAREQLQAMRVERLAQPRLDLVGITAGGQLE
jgi:hypothetical protein